MLHGHLFSFLKHVCQPCRYRKHDCVSRKKRSKHWYKLLGLLLNIEKFSLRFISFCFFFFFRMHVTFRHACEAYAIILNFARRISVPAVSLQCLLEERDGTAEMFAGRKKLALHTHETRMCGRRRRLTMLYSLENVHVGITC